MAGRVHYVSSYGGWREVLKSSEAAALVRGRAEKIAENARGQGHTTSDGQPLPIVVESGVTDRQRASVTIAHPSGMAMQAKHGVLTTAAASVGLEVGGA